MQGDHLMMCSVLGGEEELPDEGDLDAAIAALARLSSSLSTITSAPRIQFVYKMDPLDISQGVLLVSPDDHDD